MSKLTEFFTVSEQANDFGRHALENKVRNSVALGTGRFKAIGVPEAKDSATIFGISRAILADPFYEAVCRVISTEGG
jgi:hypothetical protein